MTLTRTLTLTLTLTLNSLPSPTLIRKLPSNLTLACLRDAGGSHWQPRIVTCPSSLHNLPALLGLALEALMALSSQHESGAVAHYIAGLAIGG